MARQKKRANDFLKKYGIPTTAFSGVDVEEHLKYFICKRGPIPEFFFNPHELVILGDTVTAGHGTGLYLAAADTHDKI